MEELYDEMMAQVNSIRSEDIITVDSAIQAINFCRNSMQELRAYIQTHQFSTAGEEIDFFKMIKPRFHAQLIFNIKVYNIEINRPTGSKSIVEEYLSGEFFKLKLFFDSHTAFYQYYRSGETSQDEQYFMRGKAGTRNGAQVLYIDADPNFSTMYDYQVARILANDMLSIYLNKALSGLNAPQTKDVASAKSELTWTGSKVALGELVYAFHAAGVFNNSQADIKSVTDYLCRIFNLEIGNIYKVFEEIRLRKKNRTVFLDSLRQNLLQRMDRDDEQAL